MASRMSTGLRHLRRAGFAAMLALSACVTLTPRGGSRRPSGKLRPSTRTQLTALPTRRLVHQRRHAAEPALLAARRRSTRRNVARLKACGAPRCDGSGMSPRAGNQAQPLVYDGVVYIMTGDNDAFAISVDTGEVLWEYKANIDPKVARPCCSWVGRGLGLGEGKVFVGQLDAKLVALDQRHRQGRVVDPGRRPQARLRHRERARSTTTASSSPASPAATWARAAG